MSEEQTLLRQMFDAAVSAAQPDRVIAANLPAVPNGRTIVIGAGKASAAMAQAFERHWPGPKDKLSGLVITRYDYDVPCESIEIVQAAHPVPDQAGLEGARRMLTLLVDLSADDLVVCLVSGGASALLTMPADGLTLDDKQAVNRQLLASGANIQEMNCVRKHLSAIKGGRLAAACAPAKLVSLLISDVPDDDPAVIGSGPTVADPTTYADALAIMRKYELTDPGPAWQVLQKGAAGELVESVKPGDACLAGNETRIVAAPQLSLTAAAEVARAAGYTPMILGDSIEGEAREVALVHAGIAKQIVRHGQPLSGPCVLLSGGETTVTVKGTGRGGRNAEFGLALALALNGLEGVHALVADTDGIDGSEDNAGVFVTPSSLARGQGVGVSAAEALENNDGYGFFAAIDDLLVTGPTMTNVNDFRALLIR